jgi:arsenate reductase
MTRSVYNVLFLCTGNSARSILAEASLNQLGRGRFRAFSAGSHPTGQVNPLALELLARLGIPAGEPRSKSWEEFAVPGAPPLHFVFTVCDSAAGESCPIWPGQPFTAHWGVEDPAAASGSLEERQAAFRAALRILTRRIELFVNLPMEKLDRLALQERLAGIGRS